MTLDAKLKWKEHIKKKKEELNIKYRKLYWLLGRNSELSVQNKILIYNQILKPVWMYGTQIWGCAKKTNIEIIQSFQNKCDKAAVEEEEEEEEQEDGEEEAEVAEVAEAEEVQEVEEVEEE
ncbi:hypothetical protein RF55_14395 [Lasius niger]|uniref:Uncharacterized protein n=1 Tax=Lasius niger TaxID=67767 RepID=A0A0J7K8R2_LASNI|nr:hypothetical protein RF55_14395 [Lasius niger]